MDEDKLPGRAVRGAPAAPAGRGLPDARLAQRGRRRGAGGVAAAQPLRRRRHRQPRRLADDGRPPGCASTCSGPAQPAREEPLDSHVPDPIVTADDGHRPRAGGAAGRLGRARPAGRARHAGAGRAAGVRAARHVRGALRRDRHRSSGARPRRPVSSPAAPGVGCRAPRRAGRPTASRQREVVDAFLAAARGGDFEALVAVLDPDVVLRSDGGTRTSLLVQGAEAVAGRAITFARPGAEARPVLVNGEAGILCRARWPTGRADGVHRRPRQGRPHQRHQRPGPAGRDGPVGGRLTSAKRGAPGSRSTRAARAT